MDHPDNINVTETQHPVPGGEEVDITITVPTPAGEVHPDTPVVPADTPTAVPQPAGELAPGTPVISPGVPPVDAGAAPSDTPAANTPEQPGQAGAAPSDTAPAAGAGPAEQPVSDRPSSGAPDVVTAREVDANVPVARVDDPEKTPVPAGDLDPTTPVHNPDKPTPLAGPVTAAELSARVIDPISGETNATSAEWQHLLDALDGAGFAIVRK